MRDRTALMMLALGASLCCPAAAALSADPGEMLPALRDATPSLPEGPLLNASLPVVDQGLFQVSVNGKASAHVALQMVPGDSAGPAQPADATVATPPSFGARMSSAVAPAAEPALVAFLVGALAIGIEGLRTLHFRVSGRLGRFGRILAGWLPGLALFSRIEGGNLLNNPVRARIHDVVAQDPGLSLSEVRSRTGIAWGTAVHHLRRLEAHGMVVSVSQLAHRRYFAANTPAASQRTAMTVVIHPTARRIAHLVSQRPGIGQTGICHALGLNNPAASKHLRQFETQGLVLSRRDGNSRIYHPTGALHSALLLLEPASAPVEVQPYAMAAQSAAGVW
jgi:DNA-binding MarR family transcriptional regulator